MSLKPKILRESFREGTGLTLIDAPWRHNYFDLPKDPDCFICRAIAANPRNDAKNLLLLRGERAVILLNRYPYTMGALMVAPIAHIADFRELDDATALEMTHLVKKGMSILDAALAPKAYNMGINQGIDAGAGLKDHLHIHIVPRWGADTNFMTVTAGTRVLAEDVDSMYRRLRRTLRKLEQS
ncbi:MAG TPA: HIT domain-containing protein [Anaerolineae bacterium]|nr:HIT domain-containing protein [Anaerolineae bacterium]